MEQAIELIVFDIAGTAIRDTGAIALAFRLAMQEFGYEVPLKQINPLMGYKKPEAIIKMLEVYELERNKITDSYVDAIHKRFLSLMIDYYASTPDLQPLPGVEKVFVELKQRKIKVGLNTGFSNDITEVIIERLGWLQNDMIDYVISSNEVKAGRPQPYMIHEMMKRANVDDPRKVIKVGDTEVDVNEGKNAECLYSIGITTGAYSREELKLYEPSFIIDSMDELLGIVDKHLLS